MAGAALEDTAMVALGAILHGVLLQVLRVHLVTIGAGGLVRVVLLVAGELVRVRHGALIVHKLLAVRRDGGHVLHGAVASGGLARFRINGDHRGLGRRLVGIRHALVRLLERGFLGVALRAGQVGVLRSLRAAGILHGVGLVRMAGLAVDLHVPVNRLRGHGVFLLCGLRRIAGVRTLGRLRAATCGQSQQQREKHRHGDDGRHHHAALPRTFLL